MVELQEIEPGNTKQTFGGDTLNTAIYCARLAKGLPLHIDYVTALGTDGFSRRMIDFWEAEGVGSRLVQQQQGELPGLYYIELDDDGERIFHYWRSTAAVKKCFEYPDSEKILTNLADYDGIYMSGISLAILTPKSRTTLLNRLAELKTLGVSIYFDCNYRPHLWSSEPQVIDIYQQLYRISDIVFLTKEEGEILLDGAEGDRVHEKLKSFGVRESVLKDGEKPCTILSNNQIVEVAAQTLTSVVDTTAAGDSFSAVYMVARRFGCSPVDAAEMAHRVAAYVVCHKGAVAPMEEMPITGADIISCSE